MMLDRFGTEIVGIATAIIGLAVIAVLVSQQGKGTAAVIKAAGDALSSDIAAAVKPAAGI
jgi:membrane DNA delivery protein